MAGTHALLTGNTRRMGNRVTLPDGTEVDTTAEVIYLESQERAVEVAHQIALGHVEHGHPDDIDVDPKARKPVQRPFVYDDAPRRGKKG